MTTIEYVEREDFQIVIEGLAKDIVRLSDRIQELETEVNRLKWKTEA